MAVYLIGFAVSTALIAYAQKKRSSLFFSISVIALLIPCLIAGLRSQDVGTDIMVYVKNLTVAAIRADSLQEYFNSYWYLDWRNMYVQDIEPAFSLMVYLVAKLTHSLGAVLFVIQAVIILPIYAALSRNRKTVPVWLGMLIYYFLYYNATLNQMRQWVAMAFLLLAFQMLRERKKGLLMLFSVVGFLFHFSAIIVIAVYAVYWLLWAPRRIGLAQQNLKVQSPTLIAVILFAVAMLLVMNLPLVLKLFSLVGFNRYNNYLDGGQFQIMLNQIILRLPLLAVLAVSWKELNKEDKAAPFYLAMVLLDIVASQLVSVDVNAIRIGYFFAIYAVLWIPSVYRACGSGVKRTTITVLLVAYAVFFWYYTYVVQLRHETYPYHFFFEGLQ